MTSRCINIISMLIAAVVAAAVAGGLWLDYRQDRNAHAEMLVIRGQTVLTALEGGLRSHRRMGGGFEQNVRSMVEESAKASGILGLGIYGQEGRPLASVGNLPGVAQLKAEPQWTGGGLLLALQTRIHTAGNDAGGRGPGWGRGRGMDEKIRAAYEGQVWLAVLLDDTQYRHTLARGRWRFALSLLATMMVVLLGLGLIALLQRQGRLRAELGLAAEREKRLEELTRLGEGLAHETKNPLSLIRGLAQQWLARPDTAEETQQAAQQIVDESDRVVGRINSFLAYSCQLSPIIQVFNLAVLLDETARLFHDEARSKGVELAMNLHTAWVSADPDMIRQVMVNLLANALAFCRRGDRIEVALEPNTQGAEQQFILMVRDSGPGIAPADLPLVTKPYFSRRPGGTGLGLGIVKQITEAHGWHLEIQSPSGQGTAVRIGGIKETGVRQP